MPTARIPTSVIMRHASGSGRKSQGAPTMAAREPQVPGALGKCPMGPSVARAVANLSRGVLFFMFLSMQKMMEPSTIWPKIGRVF